MLSDKLKWVEKSLIFPYHIKNDEYMPCSTISTSHTKPAIHELAQKNLLLR